MKDIVERLRDRSDHYLAGWAREVMDEAANEIERLRSLTGATADGMSMADIKRELGIKTAV